jgi:hypothetical protein
MHMASSLEILSRVWQDKECSSDVWPELQLFEASDNDDSALTMEIKAERVSAHGGQDSSHKGTGPSSLCLSAAETFLRSWQLVSYSNSPLSAESECSLPCSQEPHWALYFRKIHFNVILPYRPILATFLKHSLLFTNTWYMPSSSYLIFSPK